MNAWYILIAIIMSSLLVSTCDSSKHRAWRVQPNYRKTKVHARDADSASKDRYNVNSKNAIYPATGAKQLEVKFSQPISTKIGADSPQMHVFIPPESHPPLSHDSSTVSSYNFKEVPNGTSIQAGEKRVQTVGSQPTNHYSSHPEENGKCEEYCKDMATSVLIGVLRGLLREISSELMDLHRNGTLNEERISSLMSGDGISIDDSLNFVGHRQLKFSIPESSHRREHESGFRKPGAVFQQFLRADDNDARKASAEELEKFVKADTAVTEPEVNFRKKDSAGEGGENASDTPSETAASTIVTSLGTVLAQTNAFLSNTTITDDITSLTYGATSTILTSSTTLPTSTALISSTALSTSTLLSSTDLSTNTAPVSLPASIVLTSLTALPTSTVSTSTTDFPTSIEPTSTLITESASTVLTSTATTQSTSTITSSSNSDTQMSSTTVLTSSSSESTYSIPEITFITTPSTSSKITADPSSVIAEVTSTTGRTSTATQPKFPLVDTTSVSVDTGILSMSTTTETTSATETTEITSTSTGVTYTATQTTPFTSTTTPIETTSVDASSTTEIIFSTSTAAVTSSSIADTTTTTTITIITPHSLATTPKVKSSLEPRNALEKQQWTNEDIYDMVKKNLPKALRDLINKSVEKKGKAKRHLPDKWYNTEKKDVYFGKKKKRAVSNYPDSAQDYLNPSSRWRTAQHRHKKHKANDHNTKEFHILFQKPLNKRHVKELYQK